MEPEKQTELITMRISKNLLDIIKDLANPNDSYQNYIKQVLIHHIRNKTIEDKPSEINRLLEEIEALKESIATCQRFIE